MTAERSSRFEVLSEKGGTFRFASPWAQEPVRVTRSRDGKRVVAERQGELWVVPTEAGGQYSITIA